MPMTVYVVDLTGKSHQIDAVTDIAIDNTTCVGLVDGTYRDEGPIYTAASDGPTGVGGPPGTGIPQPGVATVGGGYPAASIWVNGGTIPTGLPFMSLPDFVSHVAPQIQINPQSVVKFTVSTQTFAGIGIFWFANQIKGIKTALSGS